MSKPGRVTRIVVALLLLVAASICARGWAQNSWAAGTEIANSAGYLRLAERFFLGMILFFGLFSAGLAWLVMRQPRRDGKAQ